MHQDYIDKAYALAHEEKARGQECVMVLFPSRPSYYILHCTEVGVYTRYSDEHCGLLSLPVDTLIVVGPSDADWDEHGIRLAKERTRASRNAKIIYLNEDY